MTGRRLVAPEASERMRRRLLVVVVFALATAAAFTAGWYSNAAMSSSTPAGGLSVPNGDLPSSSLATDPTATRPAVAEPTKPPGDPTLGTKQSIGGGSAAALAYRQPVATSAPAPTEAGYPGTYVWAGLDVKVCTPTEAPAGYAGVYVSQQPWALIYADGAVVEPSHTGYAGFPEPAYGTAPRSVDSLPVRIRPHWKDDRHAQAVPR